MKIKLSATIALFLLLFNYGVNAQVKAPLKVTFVLSAPGLTADSAVYITGNNAQLGNWAPDQIKMDYRGTSTFIKTITVDSGASLEYKFTRGSWAMEGANASGAPLPNFRAKINAMIVLTANIMAWTKGNNKPSFKGKITGTVKYHKDLKGTGIKKRDVIVWLPPGYDETDKTTRYPVLYMQDGQNIFNPATSTFGIDWQIDEAADSMIKANQIVPVIVVGIYNTADRMKEYMPGPLSQAYMDFIVKDLKPMIDSAYRTRPDSRNTIIGGSSAGGTLSFMMVWEHPDVFSKAICMSPAFKIEQWDYVKTVNEGVKKNNVFFYIDNGGAGLDEQLQPGVNAMLGALKARGYKEKEDFVFVADPAAAHSEPYWAKRFPAVLKLLVPKK